MSQKLATITTEESDRLLKQLLTPSDYPRQTRHGHRNLLMALLMLDAGLRCGEVVQLLQGDLVLLGDPVTSLRIRAEIAKRNRERIIPLTQRTRETINNMQSHVWQPTPNLTAYYAFYVTTCQCHLSRRQLQRIIKSASHIAIGRQIHPHVLRHTFASRLMRTCNARIVQELLGHANLSSTQIYTHPNHQDLTNAIKNMEF